MSLQMDPATSAKALKVICAAAATIPLAFVSWSLAKVFSTLMNAMGHNPVIIDKGLTVILICAALMETVALFILLIVSIILFAA